MELVITKVILDLAVRPVNTFAPSVTMGNLQQTTDFRALCLMISDLRQGLFSKQFSGDSDEQSGLGNISWTIAECRKSCSGEVIG